MWFQMPKGCNGISVELQHFEVEIKDTEERGYFRAPDHFAPKILAIGGFSIVSDPPGDFPEDLPRTDPLRDSAIAELTKSTEAMKTEMRNLREDLGSALAKINALVTEKSELFTQLQEKDKEIAELEDQLENKPQETVKKK